jgi:acyl-CoA synthetase (AMP-forming)/AMP-acid ligase II
MRTPGTLVDLLRARAEEKPDFRQYTFLVDGDDAEVSFTCAELDERARAIATWLQAVGNPGDRAVLLFPPGLDYIAAFFGCLYAGVVAVPAYPPDPFRLERSLPRLATILADAQPRFLLTTSEIRSFAELMSAGHPELGSPTWIATDGIPGADASGWRDPQVTPDTIAFLQYTSGSTSAPRGVMLSSRNLLHNLELIHDFFGADSGCSSVSWLPPYHDMGLIGGILCPLCSATPVTLMSPLAFLQRPFRWLSAISRSRARVSGGPNFAYDLCVRKVTPEQRATLDLSSWDLAFNGAEPIHAETLERFASAFAPCGFDRSAFYPCYGLAEATLIVSGGRKGSGERTLEVQTEALAQNDVVAAACDAESRTLVGCGSSAPEQRVAIVHPTTHCACAEDQVGEIWVSGPSVAKGYWGRLEDTHHTFNVYLAETGEGPFLRTGDLGFLHGGELFVTGRIKDLIIVDGRNHYPQDLEQTVEECHPAVRPGCCAVFAIHGSGPERVAVVAELRRETNETRSFEPNDVASVIKAAIARTHDIRVHEIVFLGPGTIPKTSSGKIQRHACHRELAQGKLRKVA